MRLAWYSEEGRFNFCDTSEVSIKTNFRVLDDEEKCIEAITITTEEKIELSPECGVVSDAVYYIDEWAKRTWSTQKDKVLAFKSFIIGIENLLNYGTISYHIKSLEAKVERIRKEIEEAKEKQCEFADKLFKPRIDIEA